MKDKTVKEEAADGYNSDESTDSVAASDYLTSQSSLEREAKALMPYDPSECTYLKGPLRQSVYACLTCAEKTGHSCGVCFACSINCHSKHNLVELFTKRNFVCDCGTSRSGQCNIRYRRTRGKNGLQSTTSTHTKDDVCSSSNRYNQNFKGVFCSCHREYDPDDDSNMYQCQFGEECGEDWYHEDCIMGLTPNKTREKVIVVDDSETEEDKDDDGSGFPDLSTFETIVCWRCVAAFKKEFEAIEEVLDCKRVYHVRTATFDEREEKLHGRKRTKFEYPYTLLLKGDFKEELKKAKEGEDADKTVVKFLDRFPFMYQDDPIYEPPEDSDESSSLFELGMREMEKVPVEQALSGVEAYEKMKTKLREFLRPFAEQKRIVTKEEVDRFFEGVKKDGE